MIPQRQLINKRTVREVPLMRVLAVDNAEIAEKFTALQEYCEETYEIGYEMLWQGVPE